MTNKERAREALNRARALRASRLLYGVSGIVYLVHDVDSDWLENWEHEQGLYGLEL